MMISTQKTSSRAAAAIEHILALGEASEDGIVHHDLSDPRHADFVDYVMRGAGRTPERYPALFARIAPTDAGPGARVLMAEATAPTPEVGAADPAPPAAFVSNQYMTYAGVVDATKVTAARAMFTRTAPIKWATVVVSAYDTTAPSSSLAFGSLNLVAGQQTGEVITDDSTALPYPASNSVTGVVTWSVEYQDGTTESSSQTTPWALYAARDPSVVAPVQRTGRTSGNLNAIVIGIARAAPAADIDYDYSIDPNTYTMLVPLDGTMAFKYPIIQILSVNLQLALTEGGAGPAQGSYLPSFSVDPTDPAGKTLTYSIVKTPAAPLGGINFGKCNWQTDTTAYFTAQVFVSLQNPNGPTPLIGWSTVMSTDAPDVNPNDGVAQIKPVMFVWHCVVEGTQITMADGTQKSIELIDSGDQVMSSIGVVRGVLATLAQPHWGPVTTITTAAGLSLTCSATHPIITSTGPQQAGSLEVGTSIQTASGTDQVAGLTISQQAGERLYNLWLDPTAAGLTVMIASGIYTGDYQMQVTIAGDRLVDPERLRAALPAELHVDLKSHLEDLSAAAR